MDHVRYMFIFDNISGWVDENPPFSDLPWSVSWVSSDGVSKNIVECDSVDMVNYWLDALGAATDDRD